jgi:hypothetical protein
MTSIQSNAAAAATPSDTLRTAMAGQELVLASAIMGRMLNPLGAGPFASARLPSAWAVQAFAQEEPQAQWTATTGTDGTASIDLGDGYTMTLNENSSEAVIHNANTGETTQIYGDPHVNVNGEHQFDFYGTTTFTLGNGTKITIETEQSRGNPNVYYANDISITKGAQAITISGLSEQDKGDLAISMGQNGYAVDARHDDGYVLNEKEDGSGWTSAYTGRDATQADLDMTRPGVAQAFQAMQTLAGLGALFGGFLMLGAIALESQDGTPRGTAAPHPQTGVEPAFQFA